MRSLSYVLTKMQRRLMLIVSDSGERLLFEHNSQTNNSPSPPVGAPFEVTPMKFMDVHCQGNNTNNCTS